MWLCVCNVQKLFRACFCSYMYLLFICVFIVHVFFLFIDFLYLLALRRSVFIVSIGDINYCIICKCLYIHMNNALGKTFVFSKFSI